MPTTITALPTPPSRADDPANFQAKADAFVGALPTFVTEANTVAGEVETLRDNTQTIKDAAVSETTTIKTDTQAIKDAAVADTTVIYNNTVTVKGQAETARDTALGYQTGAQAARDLAQTYRDEADAHKLAAQTAAAAAAAGAGLPSLAGNAGKQLRVNTGETGVEWGVAYQRLPIFSAATDTLDQVSAMEDIINEQNAHGLSNVLALTATASLFVIGSGGGSDLASSPDGRVWTLRPVGASTGYVVSDGSGVLTMNSSGSTVYHSADVVSYSVKTATPISVLASKMAALPGIWIAPQNGGSNVARSTDNGTSWTTEATPAGFSANLLTSHAGLFVGFTSGSSYYTSATGLAGSWTTRSMPGGTNQMTRDFDGSLIAYNTAGEAHRSTNGIDWTSLGNLYSGGLKSVAGIYLRGAAGATQTRHNGKWISRTSLVNASALGAKLGDVHLLAAGVNAYVIDPTAGDAATALFEG